MPTTLAHAPARDDLQSMTWMHVALLIGAHVVLGVMLRGSAGAATLHAAAALMIGFWCAATGRTKAALCAAAYLTGGEVLWRMTSAQVPWEFGKYAVSLVLLTALIQTRRIRGPLLILCYFCLLLPGAWFTFYNLPFGDARELVSFNLSGPFALLSCAWFFSHVRFTVEDLGPVLLSLIAPVLSILVIAVVTMLLLARSGDLVFHLDSNFATSGGFGPNQVSAMLGLGALLSVFYLIRTRTSLPMKAVVATTAVVLLLQSVLTFSRSGIVLAAASGGIAAIYLLKIPRVRRAILATSFLGIVVVGIIVLPRLNAFTGDTLVDRFTSITSTNRGQLIQDEVALWTQNPILGAGVGLATVTRSGGRVAAHTEFTRLVAEHGVLGVFAMVMFVLVCVRNFRRSVEPMARAFTAALVVWVVLYMLVNAFRLVAPAFLLGLTFSTLILYSKPYVTTRRQVARDVVGDGDEND